jgi:hypothetical protein
MNIEKPALLLDHFQPPLRGRRHWTGFHSRWAGNIAVDLNRQLPEGWFAEPTVHWAIGIEVSKSHFDVATFQESQALVGASASGVAWEPPAPTKTIDFALTTDVVEVQVYRDFGDVPLVGVIELVSPANKDRPETREAFVAKYDACLREGMGLVMVDVVTELHANLHALLMERVGADESQAEGLYASGYRPVPKGESAELVIWYESLRVGAELPAMPLFLKNGPRVRVNLGETYRQTCEDLRIPRDS